jgi:hypothetical protein
VYPVDLPPVLVIMERGPRIALLHKIGARLNELLNNRIHDDLFTY